MSITRRDYPHQGLYDELIDRGGRARPVAKPLLDHFASYSDDELKQLISRTELAIREMGISFTVYSQENGSIDRAWPFDPLPRIIAKSEWDQIEAGLKQRVQALNLFIDDLYHDQHILKDKVVPEELIVASANFRSQCIGVNPPRGIWAHICGSDLVRDAEGTMYVLEDNLRVPSGVS